MNWDELYAKYGKPKPKTSKIYLIITIFLIIATCLISILFYFYPNCNSIINKINSVSTEPRSISVPNNLLAHLENVCQFSKIGEDISQNFTTVIIYSCDTKKNKEILEDLTTLSLDELKTYSYISLYSGVANSAYYLKNILSEDFSKGCNPFKKQSAELYFTILVSTEGISYDFLSGLMYMCTEKLNLNDSEKKECLMKLMGAVKHLSDQYSTIEYFGDVNKCKSRGISDIVCRKMIEYRKMLAKMIKESEIDYYQKYFLFIALLYQNFYLGGETPTPEKLEQDIVNKIDARYKSLFMRS